MDYQTYGNFLLAHTIGHSDIGYKKNHRLPTLIITATHMYCLYMYGILSICPLNKIQLDCS